MNANATLVDRLRDKQCVSHINYVDGCTPCLLRQSADEMERLRERIRLALACPTNHIANKRVVYLEDLEACLNDD